MDKRFILAIVLVFGVLFLVPSILNWWGGRPLFGVGSEHQTDLDSENISAELQQEFAEKGLPFSQNATVLVLEQGSEWWINDSGNGRIYTIRKKGDILKVYDDKKRGSRSDTQEAQVEKQRDERKIEREASAEATEDIERPPEETIITKETPLYKIEFTTEGARAVSWELKDYPRRYRKEPEGGVESVNLIPDTAKKCLTMKFHDPEIQDEIEDIRWTATTQGESDPIVFSYTTSKGISISKKIIFHPDSYFVDVDISFQNQSPEDIKLGGYDLHWGAGLTKDGMLKDMDVANEGPVALVNTEDGAKLIKHWHRTGFACFGKNYVQVRGSDYPISWVAFTSKYFAAALIPGPEPWWSDLGKRGERYAVAVENTDPLLSPTAQEIWAEWGNNSTIALVWPEFPIASDETVLHTYRVYVGPKKWDILRSIQGRDGADGADGTTEKLRLGKIIDLGRFGFLGKGALWLLKVFYRMIPNYGVGVIFLSILIKVLYFPLMNKSFKSMRKMQELQPQLKALKEKHRDDPQRMQKETMKMYKQHGASPMGGCLPMLFQLPVLFALFGTLRGAVELRGAVFISGWINDLALPDTVAMIGSIPVRILPLLMTGTMLIQQLIFGAGGGGGAKQGNKMMAFMPVIFLFFFYSVPSGLVLYWTCNSVFAMGHQYLIRRQHDTKTEDEENDGDKKGKSKDKIQETRSKRK